MNKTSFEQLNENNFSILLEKYYEYLYQNGNILWLTDNILNSRDVEYSSGEFLKRLYKEVFGQYINPNNLQTDPSLFIKQIRDLYKTKGTEESFKILFRALFDEDIVITYPWENVLVPSSGSWDVRNIVLVNFTSTEYTLNDIRLNFIEVVNSLSGNKTYFKIENYISREITNLYELYITRNSTNLSTDINENDLVYYNGEVIGEIKKGATGQLSASGQDFNLGKSFSYTFNNNTQLSFIVSSVSESGEIKKISFLKFPLFDSSVTTLYFNSNGNIGETQTDATDAQINLSSKILISYEGRYLNNKGFLSDTIHLHDGFLYQKYSYTIQSAIPRDLYIDAVENVIHPAGTLLFSISDLKSNIDINKGEFEGFNKHIIRIEKDLIQFNENFRRVIRVDEFGDFPTVFEKLEITTNRVIEPESFGVSDWVEKIITRQLYDSIQFYDQGIAGLNATGRYSDTQSFEESLEFDINKKLIDNNQFSDLLCIYKKIEEENLYSGNDDYFSEDYAFEVGDLLLYNCI